MKQLDRVVVRTGLFADINSSIKLFAVPRRLNNTNKSAVDERRERRWPRCENVAADESDRGFGEHKLPRSLAPPREVSYLRVTDGTRQLSVAIG